MENIDYAEFDKALGGLEQQAKVLHENSLNIQRLADKMEKDADDYFNKLYGYMAVNNN